MAETIDQLCDKLAGSTNVFPGSSTSYVLNGSHPNAEEFSKGSRRHVTKRRANLTNFTLCKNSLVIAASRTRRGFSKHANGVPCVLFGGDVFEIGQSRICPIAVNVVDLFSCWARTKKCLCHQAMNQTHSLAISRRVLKTDSAVSVAYNGTLHCKTGWANHSSVARNAVPSFVSDNIPPIFRHTLIVSHDCSLKHCGQGPRAVTRRAGARSLNYSTHARLAACVSAWKAQAERSGT